MKKPSAPTPIAAMVSSPVATVNEAPCFIYEDPPAAEEGSNASTEPPSPAEEGDLSPGAPSADLSPQAPSAELSPEAPGNDSKDDVPPIDLDADDLPSMGSALHASGECRRCNFFAKGRCQNGKDCAFCHLPHDRRQLRRCDCHRRIRIQMPQTIQHSNRTIRRRRGPDCCCLLSASMHRLVYPWKIGSPKMRILQSWDQQMSQLPSPRSRCPTVCDPQASSPPQRAAASVRHHLQPVMSFRGSPQAFSLQAQCLRSVVRQCCPQLPDPVSRIHLRCPKVLGRRHAALRLRPTMTTPAPTARSAAPGCLTLVTVHR